jgi:hypothetical protein
MDIRILYIHIGSNILHYIAIQIFSLTVDGWTSYWVFFLVNYVLALILNR